MRAWRAALRVGTRRFAAAPQGPGPLAPFAGGALVGCVVGGAGVAAWGAKPEEAPPPTDRDLDPSRREKLADTVALEVRRMVGAERSTLFTLEGEELVGHIPGQSVRHIRVPKDEGIVGYVYTTKSALVLDDVADHPTYDAGRAKRIEEQTGFKTLMSLAVPIVSPVTGNVLGVLQLMNKQNNKGFTASDLAAAEEVCSFIARQLQGDSVAFEDVLQLLQRRQEDPDTQERRGRQMVMDYWAKKRKLELAETVAMEVWRMVGSERSTLFLLEGDDLVGRIPKQPQHIRVPKAEGIAGHVFTKRQPLVLDDVRSHHTFDAQRAKRIADQTGYTVRNAMALPIVSPFTGLPLGVLQLLNKDDGFTDRDKAVAGEVCNYLALQLQADERAGEQLLEFLGDSLPPMPKKRRR